MHAATADAVIDAINEYVEAKIDANDDQLPANSRAKECVVAQLDRAHDRLRHVLMTGIQ